jgi:hypothetical protein
LALRSAWRIIPSATLKAKVEMLDPGLTPSVGGKNLGGPGKDLTRTYLLGSLP